MARNDDIKRSLVNVFIDSANEAVLDAMDNVDKKNIVDIDVNLVKSNPYQPRKTFDSDKLKDLAESISTHGIFTPILVRDKDKDGFYTLVAGERRLMASKLAGLETIPAIIEDFTHKEMLEISLLENLQREDLSPIEQAQALDVLSKELNYTQEDLAKRIGKSREYVANMRRLLLLPQDIQDKITNNEISSGHGRAIISIPTDEEKEAVVEKIIDEKMSVRTVEKYVKDLKSLNAKDNEFVTAEESLKSFLELERVNIKKKKIEILFDDVDELKMIINKILNKKI